MPKVYSLITSRRSLFSFNVLMFSDEYWLPTLCSRVCSDTINPGPKLKDFVATMKSDVHIQSEIAKLRNEVEEYAKQFPTVGFEKETMRYKD
jgi:hypothetical protein